MRCLRVLTLALLLGWFAGHGLASDSLRTTDTLRSSRQEMPLWADSAIAHSDSLAGGKHMLDRWWIPLGVMAVTALSTWLLFSTRSK